MDMFIAISSCSKLEDKLYYLKRYYYALRAITLVIEGRCTNISGENRWDRSWTLSLSAVALSAPRYGVLEVSREDCLWDNMGDMSADRGGFFLMLMEEGAPPPVLTSLLLR
jgi:hypothetical protein